MASKSQSFGRPDPDPELEDDGKDGPPMPPLAQRDAGAPDRDTEVGDGVDEDEPAAAPKPVVDPATVAGGASITVTPREGLEG